MLVEKIFRCKSKVEDFIIIMDNICKVYYLKWREENERSFFGERFDGVQFD